MKKFYCTRCYNEVTGSHPIPVDEIAMQAIPNFDQMPNIVKKLYRNSLNSFRCSVCDNRQEFEQTFVMDTDDPTGSLKRFKVVRVDKSDPYTPSIKIKRSGSTSILIGVVFSLVGFGIMFAESTSIYTSRDSDGLFLILFGLVFATIGVILLYFGLSVGRIKFFPDHIEFKQSVRKSNTPNVCYKNQNAVIEQVSTGSENKVTIYKITINGKTAARGLFEKDARIIKEFLDMYLNHSEETSNLSSSNPPDNTSNNNYSNYNSSSNDLFSNNSSSSVFSSSSSSQFY